MKNTLHDRLQAVLDEAVSSGLIAGASIVIDRGEEELSYNESGFADLETGRKIQRDTIYRLYSQTKPVTATAMMILLERGLIDLADPVSDYLPGFLDQVVMSDATDIQDSTSSTRSDSRATNGKQEDTECFHKAKNVMTLYDVMNMTSGLTYGGASAGEMKTSALFAEMELNQNRDQKAAKQDGSWSDPAREIGTISTLEFANRLGKCPLAFEPGTSWRYGTSSDVAGAIVEVVTGKRYGDFLQEEIFEPLGMKDTAFWVPENKQPRLAKVYDTQIGKKPVLYQGNNLAIRNDMARRPAFESGGAGLVSTIDDYRKFAAMLRRGGEYDGGHILLPETVKFMTTRNLTDRQQASFEEQQPLLGGFSYGSFMRIMKEPTRALTLGETGEYGWDGWLGCYFENIPTKDATIIMMMQKFGAGTFTLSRRVRNIVFSEI